MSPFQDPMYFPPSKPDLFQAIVNTPGMEGKIFTLKVSFEGASKTLKGSRWCTDHSTRFMITLAKAAGLCNEKVVMTEKPLSLSAAGLVQGRLFPGECTSSIGHL